MRFFTESRDAEYYAQKVTDTGGVYLVPAFTGLGAPYWDMYARGAFVGLTRGTKRSISSGRPRSPSPTRWPTWCAPWRRTPASPSPAQGRRRRQPGPLPHAVPGRISWGVRSAGP